MANTMVGMSDSVTYVQHPEFGMVQEVSSGGGSSYVEIESPEMHFMPVVVSGRQQVNRDGFPRYVAIRDVEEARKQAYAGQGMVEGGEQFRPGSHYGYFTEQNDGQAMGNAPSVLFTDPTLLRQFEDAKVITPQEMRHRQARVDAFEAHFNQLVIDRAAPAVGQYKYTIVTDEKFMELRDKWMAAKAKGEERHEPFQPLSAYAHKLIRPPAKPGGEPRVLRQIFAGEVGMYGMGTPHAAIVLLGRGYGTGGMVQVGVDLKGSQAETSDAPKEED